MKLVTCDRCGGSGWIPHFNHVEGGICFKCEGVGEVPATYRAKTNVDAKDAICDSIFSLYQKLDNGVKFAQFFIWNEGTKKLDAGTGHMIGGIIEDGERQSISTKLHSDLDTVRAKYRQLIAEGWEVIPADKHDEIFAAHVQQYYCP